jgi:hypothetical protein
MFMGFDLKPFTSIIVELPAHAAMEFPWAGLNVSDTTCYAGDSLICPVPDGVEGRGLLWVLEGNEDLGEGQLWLVEGRLCSGCS